MHWIYTYVQDVQIQALMQQTTHGERHCSPGGSVRGVFHSRSLSIRVTNETGFTVSDHVGNKQHDSRVVNTAE